MPSLSDLAKGGINVVHERRLRLAVSSHVSKGGDQAVTTTATLMSSGRLNMPSFSNSSNFFGGPQVCSAHTGADGPFLVVVQLDPCSL